MPTAICFWITPCRLSVGFGSCGTVPLAKLILRASKTLAPFQGKRLDSRASPHLYIQIVLDEFRPLPGSVLTEYYNERASVGAIFQSRKEAQARRACVRSVSFQKSMYRCRGLLHCN